MRAEAGGALLLLVAGVAGAQEAAPVERLREVEAERGRIEYWLRELEAERSDVLGVLEAVEREARTAEAAAETARREAGGARERLEIARHREDELLLQRTRLSTELGPRLTLRYRLSGATYLRALFTAGSLGDFLWRQRMVDRILRGDLLMATELARLSRQALLAREAIQDEQVKLAEAEKEAGARAEDARVRATVQQALLVEIGSRRTAHLRTVAELERARGSLLEELARMPPPPPGLGGFGSRRGRLPWPVEGRVSVAFGLQTDARFGTQVAHKGIDVAAKKGAAVIVPHAASVGFAGWFRGYGNLAVLDHGEGYYTLYAHLDALAVARGDRLEAGSVVGTVGDTGSLKGPYLYFEVRSGAKALDPAEWLSPK